MTVQVAPVSATVLLGNTTGFTASVSGTSDVAVAWSVNGIPGGNATMGAISPTGTYQAPAVLPSPSTMAIEATSQASSASSAIAAVTVTSDIRVQVTPAAASVELGATQSFGATITSAGHPATSVTWSLSGPGCAGAACGTIAADGSFTAPAILPAPASVTVTATSMADPSQSAAAAIAVTSYFTISAQGPASVTAGSTAQFTTSIQPVPGSHPATGVTWSLSGAGCGVPASLCGKISSTGLYTAPAAPPQLAQVTLTATSVADPRKTASVTTQVVAAQALVVSPANATVALEQTQSFTAMLGGAPTQAVTWSVDNIAGGNTSVGAISNSPIENGLYLAPVNMPPARQVTITATSTANPGVSSSVTLQLTSNILVSITPSSAVRIPGARQSFTASVMQTSNPDVSWAVNGIPNGNATFGQICASGSNPCQPPPLASPPGSVDYLAPAEVPTPPQVTVEAASTADPARFAAATVTIAPQISVSIQPPSLTLPPQQVQTVTAAVLGIADQNVTWDVNGSTNGSIAGGLICLPASSPCQAPYGPFAGPVEFRAPDVPPSPNVVSVRATSEASPSAQGTALFTISTAPYISALVPASLFAGAATPFGLRVMGVQFAASQPGPGSAILINGAPRATNCPAAAECDTTINPSDVSGAGTLAVSVQNAGAPPATSNTVSIIVVAPQTTTTVIALDASAPAATGMDISVVEPTLAGSDPPESLGLLEIGLVDPATQSCTLAAPPLVLARPASGSTTFQLCLLGTALDQVDQVTFSTPAAPDLTAANLDTSQGSLILTFDATLPAAAPPGPRSLFVATPNQDQAVLTAAVEVQ
ncbi:MAG TPA: hypothetical protein VJX29_00690 [Candidatus Acidoferrales bacterium]|nr:hypothetical protein [Candidatus Acidoferrales bacterium]